MAEKVTFHPRFESAQAEKIERLADLFSTKASDIIIETVKMFVDDFKQRKAELIFKELGIDPKSALNPAQTETAKK